MSTTAESQYTYQTVSPDTKEGKRQLRKLLRMVQDWNSGDWSLRADPNTEWGLVLRRRIKGDVGEPDREVDIHLNVKVEFPTPFEAKAREWRCNYIYFTSQYAIATILYLLLDGWRPYVRVSTGSQNTTDRNMLFAHFVMHKPPEYHVDISWSMWQNGQILLLGAIN